MVVIAEAVTAEEADIIEDTAKEVFINTIHKAKRTNFAGNR